MLTAPRQDWGSYEAKSRASEVAWLRSLSIERRFALYQSLFNVVKMAGLSAACQQRLDRWTWREKVEVRRRLVDAFAKLDGLQRERSAAHDAD